MHRQELLNLLNKYKTTFSGVYASGTVGVSNNQINAGILANNIGATVVIEPDDTNLSYTNAQEVVLGIFVAGTLNKIQGEVLDYNESNGRLEFKVTTGTIGTNAY